jgi:hypothetical protein
MGCDGDFNITKFTRVGAMKSKFCIDKDSEYELEGNF